MSVTVTLGRDRRALVLIPGTVNYFYNQTGRRVAAALGALGLTADVRTLGECPPGAGGYDVCVLANVSEVLLAYGGVADGVGRLRALRGGGTPTLSLALDCVATPWFHRLSELSREVGADAVLDLGLCDQSAGVAPRDRGLYRFVFNGLTPGEQARLAAPAPDAPRALPWAFVGHNTPDRVALVDHLVRHVDPGGFVYVPTLAQYREKGSPHLNEQQFERVLRQSRYQVWCSHHRHFYMEPERFRMSALTGSVPAKVVPAAEAVPADAPFRYLVMTPQELPGRLAVGAFERVRERHRRDWLASPTLAAGLSGVLDDLGVRPAAAARRAA